MKRICIFLNGKFQTSDFKIKINKTIFTPFHNSKTNNIPVYAADGGLNYYLKYKFSTSSISWVGDGDSLNKNSKLFLKHKSENFMNIIHLNKLKDLSDLAALLDTVLPIYINESIFIEIYGGLGNKRAHEYSNLEEIRKFISLLPKKSVCFFHGGVTIASAPLKFLDISYKSVSVFDNTGKVDLKGSLYSGCISLQRPSHGLSNEIIEDTFSITPLGGVSTLYFEE